MKKLLSAIIILFVNMAVNGQIQYPDTYNDNQGSENMVVGNEVDPADQDAKLEVNTTNGSNASTIKALELTTSRKEFYPQNSLPAFNIKTSYYKSFPPGYSTQNIFSIWPEGKVDIGILGTNYLNLGLLNVGGNVYFSTYHKQSMRFIPHELRYEWTASTTPSYAQNLTIGYAGDGTFPASDIIKFTPEGMVEVVNKLAIGTTSLPGGHLLYIGGSAIAEEVTIKLQSSWPDYVFSSDYTMLTNDELRNYIFTNNRLPYLPSAKEVNKNGIQTGETITQLTRLVEELTLRTLALDEEIKELRKELKEIKYGK